MSVIKLFYGDRNVGDTNQFQNPAVKKAYLLGPYYKVYGTYNKTFYTLQRNLFMAPKHLI